MGSAAGRGSTAGHGWRACHRSLHASTSSRDGRLPKHTLPRHIISRTHLLRLLTELAGDMKLARAREAAAPLPPALRPAEGVGMGAGLRTARPRLGSRSPAGGVNGRAGG